MNQGFITVIDALLLAGALQGFLLCIPLFRYRNNRTPNRILIAQTALLALDLVLAYLNNSPIVLRHPRLFDLNASFPFLFTPAMYFYVSVMTGRIDRFRARHLLHAVPFLSHAVFMHFAFYRLDDSAKLAIIQSVQDSGRIVDRLMFIIRFNGKPPTGLSLLAILALFAIAAGYIGAIARRVVHYRRELRDYYSDVRNKVQGFLTFTLITVIAIWALVTVVIVTEARNQVVPMIVYTVAIYIGAYTLLTVPEVFSGNRAMTALLETPGDETKSGHEAAIAKLTEYLKVSGAYLNPELTIGDIGEAIGVPVHRLSKALNGHLGKNFYQFVNESRVEEAKRLLSDERLADRSVLSIGMDAGFSSKSTFNDAFKRIAGVTPSDFRKRRPETREPRE